MIVAVAGGKGGVGKSTTAWNLGRELDAVVVDGDLAVPDLPSGPDAGPDLHDVLAGRADPLEAVADAGPVSVLPSGRTLSGARASSLEALPSVLDRLERRWDHVVVDCPAGLARDVGVELGCADLAVLVTTPSRAALVDAIRTSDLVASLETPLGAAVLNKADRDTHSDLADRLGRRLGVDVTLVAEQAAVADAQARWQPVRDHRPDAQAVDAYRAVADRLERASEPS
ncbi:MinD/ParA family ATP-binding protein [Halopiger xanaduensis]|uniref:Cobyrinic acid ac-diamide synthase n=1 Tax=Halopiger xanaduensis (strain DSM 18323 / JCM 14033 / SH-6) TaxID=797210 RepID=F8D3P1_HALXS|nr:cellulose synthase operon protein YhjQ/BcsQ [Halopiger xanaduensis]AEH37409.1 Cobyrinic acid ac-diamide synthase [Halopiger xanaduensis SH-6]